jgi:hypothetical protein
MIFKNFKTDSLPSASISQKSFMDSQLVIVNRISFSEQDNPEGSAISIIQFLKILLTIKLVPKQIFIATDRFSFSNLA